MRQGLGFDLAQQWFERLDGVAVVLDGLGHGRVGIDHDVEVRPVFVGQPLQGLDHLRREVELAQQSLEVVQPGAHQIGLFGGLGEQVFLLARLDDQHLGQQPRFVQWGDGLPNRRQGGAERANLAFVVDAALFEQARHAHESVPVGVQRGPDRRDGFGDVGVVVLGFRRLNRVQALEGVGDVADEGHGVFVAGRVKAHLGIA